VSFEDHHELGALVLSKDAIRERVEELGEDLGRVYAGRRVLLVGVLKGAFVFLTDLARAIPIPVEYDVIAVSSYGASTTSTGAVRLVKDLDVDITDRHVVIVEDIVDSGLTLAYLRGLLLARNPASLEVCALLARDTVPEADLSWIRWIGFRIPNLWVVGYGLDTAERWRNLSDIRVWQGAT
jgi:hypoxanthine phosphoribosyltransferase